MQEIWFAILGVVGGIFAAGVVGYLFLQHQKKQGMADKGLELLQNQLHELSRTLDSKIGEGYKFVQDSTRNQSEAAQKLIREITEELTSIKETNKQVVGFADQLQSLQDVLQNPKRRGVLGEYYLETVLKNVLPPSVFKMQYKIGKNDDGQDLIVDAALLIQDKIIPVDSKFSLENYNRLAEEKDEDRRNQLEKQFKTDLKARIDETSKYIRPQDGTMDFALMFIPSEAIFYDLIINQVGAVKVNTEELIQYAAKKRVNIVSPNSFYAFLQVILHGLRQVDFEKNLQHTIKQIEELGRHFNAYDDYYKKLGNSLRVSVNHYNAGYKEFKKMGKDVKRLTGFSADIEPDLLEKPEEE